MTMMTVGMVLVGLVVLVAVSPPAQADDPGRGGLYGICSDPVDAGPGGQQPGQPPVGLWRPDDGYVGVYVGSFHAAVCALLHDLLDLALYLETCASSSNGEVAAFMGCVEPLLAAVENCAPILQTDPLVFRECVFNGLPRDG